ncbi:MAG: serpin family protein [Desulfomonile sp.]|nr:serpin family protein [Desulfomonile sp.]
MKSAIAASAVCLLLFCGTGAAEAGDPAIPAQDQASFALRLYRSVSGEGINTFVSPLSVSATLAMVYAGARGITADQFAKILGVQQDPGLFHNAFGKLIGRVPAECKQDQCVLEMANAVWVRKGRPLLKDFTQTLREHYAAEAVELDFASDPEAARKLINSWAERHTAGKIAELLPPGSPGAAPRIVLTNAVYFKGMWALPFNREETADAPFTLFDGTNVMAPMMHVAGEFAYTENERCQALELPYAGSPFSTVILLPRGHDDIRDLESSLSTQSLTRLLGGMIAEQVQVSLPRFSIRFKALLAKHLQAMGLTDAFAVSSADFSGIDGSRDLHISDVVHEACIEVNEEGTEAAAATGAQAMDTGVRQVKEFTANRSFFFFIRHRETGTILFMGCILHPLR